MHKSSRIVRVLALAVIPVLWTTAVSAELVAKSPPDGYTLLMATAAPCALRWRCS